MPIADKINKLTLSEQIYNILKSDILAGSICLGDKLTNRELQERFQVSSTPVRDAINKLNQDGLISEVTKTGAQLIRFDIEYSGELNEFILALSCEAVSLSSRAADTHPVIQELSSHLDSMIAAQNDEAYFDADYRFHRTFFDYSGNRFLKETYKRYNLIRFLLMHHAVRTMEHKAASIQQHRQIIDAYASRDYVLARTLTEYHYLQGIQLISKNPPEHQVDERTED